MALLEEAMLLSQCGLSPKQSQLNAIWSQDQSQLGTQPAHPADVIDV